MTTKIKSLLGVCAMGVCALGSSAAFAAGCPDPGAYPSNGCSLGNGVVAGSFPYFQQSVYVTVQSKKNGDFSLKASYGGVASNTSDFVVGTGPQDVYSIDNTFYQLKAKDKHGDLTGSIRIMGKLNGSNAKETLMTADLTGVWDSSGSLIGFNTMNIQCSASINALAPCTSAEVVYLTQLQQSLDLGGVKGKTSTTGLAVTSVPLPAAAWLFGSGLLGLVGVSRRKHA
jgi:hypothetical protein